MSKVRKIVLWPLGQLEPFNLPARPPKSYRLALLVSIAAYPMKNTRLLLSKLSILGLQFGYGMSERSHKIDAEDYEMAISPMLIINQ